MRDGVAGRLDFDPARLQRLWHFALQLDDQHAVGVVRGLDSDVVGKVEPTLERTGGDAAVQILAIGVIVGATGRNHERILALLNGQILVGEARDGDLDCPGIIAGLFDVVGG